MTLKLWNVCVLIILFISLCSKTCIGSEFQNDFDVLTFAQTWPIAHCIFWMDQSKDNACLLPPERNKWTIHGVWPNKHGSFGPEFCNNSLRLNTSALEPLKDELNKYWPNTHKGSRDDSLWKYQWNKHGTCAIGHDALNTEVKYFGKGLEWSKQYSIGEILSKSNVNPGALYDFATIHNAIKSALNTTAWVSCISEKNRPSEQYLNEIRICFNRTLELVDCRNIFLNGLSHSGYSNTNCNTSQPIYYPNGLTKHIHGKPSKSIWQIIWENLSKSSIWFRF